MEPLIGIAAAVGFGIGAVVSVWVRRKWKRFVARIVKLEETILETVEASRRAALAVEETAEAVNHLAQSTEVRVDSVRRAVAAALVN